MKKRYKKIIFSFTLTTFAFIFWCNYFVLVAEKHRPIKQLPNISHYLENDFLLQKYIQNNGSNKSKETQFSDHFFAMEKSDKIGYYRNIIDTRHPNCKRINYDFDDDLTVSVIISFYNEARSTLLRTIISILNRTPPQHLQEIILVDDCSDNEFDGKALNFLPFIKLHRNENREGLIRSRNKGAQISSGQFIIFIDSHCEVNIGWLEPLLDRLYINPKAAVSPILDSIDARTFRYKASSTYLRGGFDWNLRFKWIPMSEQERESRNSEMEPFISPTFSGGVFIISRSWFFQLGGFDTYLETFGGESLEMSLKVWLCGGQIEVIPCSRVGHVFRKRHPYNFPLGRYYTHLRNSKRIADTWLEEYSHFFYQSKPWIRTINVPANEKALHLKEEHQCKKFSWYMQNVFTELRLPNEEDNAFGQIKIGLKCLTADNGGREQKVLLNDCNDDKNSRWALKSKTKTLSTESGACLNARKRAVVLEYCKDNDSQKWDRKGGQLIHEASRLCLDNIIGNSVVMTECRRGAPSQLFSFSVEFQHMR